MDTEPLAEPFDTFICNVGALLKKQETDGPELRAVLEFFRTHGYAHIADDLSFSIDSHSLGT